MATARLVWIDALPESAYRHLDAAVVCVDVLLFSTSVVTAVGTGRRTFAASTATGAASRAASLARPLLAAEGAADPPPGFRSDCGPTSLEHRVDLARPLLLLSPAARVLENAAGAPETFVACLRNLSATVAALAARHSRVALVAAGADDEVRCEDQVATAWLAQSLVARGFEPEGRLTVRELERWGRAELSVVRLGKGAEELRTSGREDEVRFVLEHVDDLALPCVHVGGEVAALAELEQRLAV